MKNFAVKPDGLPSHVPLGYWKVVMKLKKSDFIIFILEFVFKIDSDKVV